MSHRGVRWCKNDDNSTGSKFNLSKWRHESVWRFSNFVCIRRKWRNYLLVDKFIRYINIKW